MSRNVVNFPKPYRAPQVDEFGVVASGEPPYVARSPLSNAVRSVLRGLAYLVFLVLLWIRGPIHFILSLVVGAGMIAGVVLWLSSGYARRAEFMHIGFGVSFGAFCLMFGYDQLLYRLSPVPLFLS